MQIKHFDTSAFSSSAGQLFMAEDLNAERFDYA
jgi:hypothetical protein